MEFITAGEAFEKQYQIHSDIINQELGKIFAEIDQTIKNNPKDNYIIVNYEVSRVIEQILIGKDYKVVITEYSDRAETRIIWQLQ